MFDGITDSMDTSLSKLQELVMDKGGLVCCSPWDHKELNMTEQLNQAEHSSRINILYCIFNIQVYSLHGLLPCHGEGACLAQ